MLRENLRQISEGWDRLHELNVLPPRLLPGYAYADFEGLVVAKGREFSSSPLTPAEWKFFLEASRRALLLHRKRDWPIKQCFANAQRIVLADHSGRLTYAEGYSIGVIPVLHGWVLLDHAKVIDVTLRLFEKSEHYRRRSFRDRCIGEFPRTREYIGLEFDATAVRQHVIESNSWSSFIDDYERGFPLLKAGVPELPSPPKTDDRAVAIE